MSSDEDAGESEVMMFTDTWLSRSWYPQDYSSNPLLNCSILDNSPLLNFEPDIILSDLIRLWNILNESSQGLNHYDTGIITHNTMYVPYSQHEAWGAFRLDKKLTIYHQQKNVIKPLVKYNIR